MRAKRKTIKVVVTLSYGAESGTWSGPVTVAQAKRELRSRVNDLCCYSRDESEVRVRKVERFKP